MTVPQKTPAPKKPEFKVHVVFGEDDVRRLGEHRYAQMENGYATFAYPTEAEMKAFLEGLDTAIGWMEYAVLDGRLKNGIDRARRRRTNRRKEGPVDLSGPESL